MVSYRVEHTHLRYDPAILPLGIYLMKRLFTQKPYMNAHSSFTHNSPNLKQPKSPLIDEWLNCGTSVLCNTT